MLQDKIKAWAQGAGVQGDLAAICSDPKTNEFLLKELTATGKEGKLKVGMEIPKAEEIKATAQPATEAEARLYYTLNPQPFQTDARIVGRQIVVADRAKAESLLAQARGGADFAALASANSTEFKDRGGALGPLEGGSPRPVAQVALPAEVGVAAFA